MRQIRRTRDIRVVALCARRSSGTNRTGRFSRVVGHGINDNIFGSAESIRNGVIINIRSRVIVRAKRVLAVVLPLAESFGRDGRWVDKRFPIDRGIAGRAINRPRISAFSFRGGKTVHSLS